MTDNLNDGYLGSGRALSASIKKYGRDCFIRDVLFELPSEESMNLKEKELVTEELVNDPNCYNLAVGGEGGPMFKGKTHTEETRAKLREIRKLQTSPKRTEEQKETERARRYAQNDGKWFNDSTIEKIRAAAYRRHGTTPDNPKTPVPFSSLSEEQKLERISIANEKRSASLKGHVVTDSTRSKLRAANIGKTANNKGRICINNGIKNKFVTPDLLEYYLANGYIKGGVSRS